jgi:hypothetical protein
MKKITDEQFVEMRRKAHDRAYGEHSEDIHMLLNSIIVMETELGKASGTIDGLFKALEAITRGK